MRFYLRSDGNAPQTPLSQSDILNERTPLRLNFEGKDLSIAAKTQSLNPLARPRNGCLRQILPTGLRRRRFPQTVVTFRRETRSAAFLSGGSAVTK